MRITTLLGTVGLGAADDSGLRRMWGDGNMHQGILVALVLAALLTGSVAGGDTGATVELVEGWRFKPDPDDVGMGEAWFAPAHDDVEWAVIDAGEHWEDQGWTQPGREYYIQHRASRAKVGSARLAGSVLARFVT